jgi:hypothetical protein
MFLFLENAECHKIEWLERIWSVRRESDQLDVYRREYPFDFIVNMRRTVITKKHRKEIPEAQGLSCRGDGFQENVTYVLIQDLSSHVGRIIWTN